MQVDEDHLEPWLQRGQIDFAMGSYRNLMKGIRRQKLWTERYVSVVRSGHPRIGRKPTQRMFAAEKHVLVSTSGTGHAHQLAERALERIVPAENIICRVPMFISAAVLAKHTDAVATLPWSMASVLVQDLQLQLVTPPVDLPQIEIFQYWHERFHRDAGNQWIRSVFLSLFAKKTVLGRKAASDTA
jgi:DNA-binding transcriptional LysR family regulator